MPVALPAASLNESVTLEGLTCSSAQAQCTPKLHAPQLSAPTFLADAVLVQLSTLLTDGPSMGLYLLVMLSKELVARSSRR